MTTYNFSGDDRRLIVYACGCAIKHLLEYKAYHEEHGEDEEIQVCLREIEKHKRMIGRMKEAGPIPVE